MTEKFPYEKIYQEQVEAWKQYKTLIHEYPLLDEDGYPTEYAIKTIRNWHWSDTEELFKFVRELWCFGDYGWKECESIDEISGKKGYCYYISTCGWSGNESIIRALQENEMFWHLNWKQSRRGGHYIFELKEFKDE